MSKIFFICGNDFSTAIVLDSNNGLNSNMSQLLPNKAENKRYTNN